MNRQHGSARDLLHADYPVTMHLLMETAIGDSQQYEVLSVEVAEELKRELSRLSSRIEATKRQLAIETKVRDAATSLNKLDGRAGHRRGTGSRGVERNDDDLAAAQQKCEELAQELWQMEKRQQDVQRQLLEHTAGILQMTHKGFLEKDAPAQLNGIDGQNTGNNYLDFTGGSDDHSFYRTLDSLLEENAASGGSAAYKQQTEAILETERKLWDFNQRLREAIIQASSGRAMVPEPPEPGQSESKESEGALQIQMSYLERGFDQVQKGQVEAAQRYKLLAQKTEERLEDLNTQLRSIVIRSSQEPNPHHPLPPELTGRGADEQIAFLENGLDTLEQGVFRLKEDHHNLALRSGGHEERAVHFEDVLRNIWPSISEGEQFSTDAFAYKISNLNTRLSDLTNQKDILNRQIQQQREVNSKSDGEKDAKLALVTREMEQAKAEADKTRQEMQDVEGEMVRLQTEVTVARAELDGAYGTRAQRAAEVAQHPALQQEIADLRQELEATKVKSNESAELQHRVQTLQKELSETISEYEVMTKSSIEFEKERESLENTIDSLRDRCEALETQLSEEKVNKLGAKSPGTPGDRGSNEKGATSTSVLKTEFKKMMRETRAENMRALRVSLFLCPSSITDNLRSMNKTSVVD